MRLVDADKATKILHEILDPIADKKLIWLAWDVILEDCDTIEAEPIRHGKWKHIKAYKGADFGFYQCSVCGDAWWFKTKYCANCGAKMDEDEISNIARESADKISKALEKVRAKGMQKQNIKKDDEP